MAIVAVDLGSAPTGAGGDTNREAFTKLNDSIDELDLRAAIPGDDGVGVPVGGTTGQALTKVDATDFNTAWTTPAATAIEAVAGAAGFANVSGAVTLDLATARNFLHNVNGNVTSVALSNVPAAASWVAPVLLAVKFADSGHMYSSFLSTETVVWFDGRSTADLIKTGGLNLITLVKVDGIVHANLLWNGATTLDPYVLSFPANGTQLLPITRAETLGLNAITNLAADGTAGTGTVTFKKDGGADISVATAFAAGEVLTVTMASSTTPSAVSIPRTA